MLYYFAPLEGLTDRTYRRIHHKYFSGIDRYFTPFLSPTQHRALTPRESRELPPADTLGYMAVPQLLSKVPEDFTWMAAQCADLGYKEVNLNLGCPSGTVTAKGKGAGMLADPDSLDRFLDGIFSNAPLPISVKTRLGVSATEEFPVLLDIFNRYPIRELTIHPRVRKDFYDTRVKMEAFEYALQNSRNVLCFNGNLCTASQIAQFRELYPQVNAVMLGRGLIGDPGMLMPGGTDRETLTQFHNELLEAYLSEFSGARNAMSRMKEHWRYLLCRFQGSEKLGKQLRKTTDLSQFQTITSQILCSLPMHDSLAADW